MNSFHLKISIVTPSLNQGSFIEKTILSVLSQDYPTLEYIITDGGSTDNTIKILNKYSNKVIWLSEKDKGQAEAINKGLVMASGDVVTYLNADDLLLPGALKKVAYIFTNHPKVMWLTGRCKIIDENSREIRRNITLYKNALLRSKNLQLLMVSNFVSQPATFWRRRLVQRIGLFDERLHYALDYDYWLRLWSQHQPHILNDYLAEFRIQKDSKTASLRISKKWIEEENLVLKRYTNSRLRWFLHSSHNKLMALTYSQFK